MSNSNIQSSFWQQNATTILSTIICFNPPNLLTSPSLYSITCYFKGMITQVYKKTDHHVNSTWRTTCGLIYDLILHTKLSQTGQNAAAVTHFAVYPSLNSQTVDTCSHPPFFDLYHSCAIIHDFLENEFWCGDKTCFQSCCEQVKVFRQTGSLKSSDPNWSETMSWE